MTVRRARNCQTGNGTEIDSGMKRTTRISHSVDWNPSTVVETPRVPVCVVARKLQKNKTLGHVFGHYRPRVYELPYILNIKKSR
jgi:hypothetical protein